VDPLSGMTAPTLAPRPPVQVDEELPTAA